MRASGSSSVRRVFGRAAAAILCGLALVSCATFQKGQAIARYERGAATYSVKAPSTSDYALYASDGLEPKLTVRVEEGAPIGFDRGENGQLLAVAGDQKVPIESASYTWRRR